MLRGEITPDARREELRELRAVSRENISDCMQCGKCSAGCPASADMDLLPHQVVRLLQLGQWEAVADSQSVWNCASCFTCGARCPRNINIASLLEAVRLTLARRPGGSRFTADSAGERWEAAMPQQAMVSAFRKYGR